MDNFLHLIRNHQGYFQNATLNSHVSDLFRVNLEKKLLSPSSVESKNSIFKKKNQRSCISTQSFEFLYCLHPRSFQKLQCFFSFFFFYFSRECIMHNLIIFVVSLNFNFNFSVVSSIFNQVHIFYYFLYNIVSLFLFHTLPTIALLDKDQQQFQRYSLQGPNYVLSSTILRD